MMKYETIIRSQDNDKANAMAETLIKEFLKTSNERPWQWQDTNPNHQYMIIIQFDIHTVTEWEDFRRRAADIVAEHDGAYTSIRTSRVFGPWDI